MVIFMFSRSRRLIKRQKEREKEREIEMGALSLKKCVFQNKRGLAVDEESKEDIEMDLGL